MVVGVAVDQGSASSTIPSLSSFVNCMRSIESSYVGYAPQRPYACETNGSVRSEKPAGPAEILLALGLLLGSWVVPLGGLGPCPFSESGTKPVLSTPSWPPPLALVTASLDLRSVQKRAEHM